MDGRSNQCNTAAYVQTNAHSLASAISPLPHAEKLVLLKKTTQQQDGLKHRTINNTGN